MTMAKAKKQSDGLSAFNEKNVKNKARIKSVSDSSAQSATLYTGQENKDTLLTNVYALLMNNRELTLCDKAIIECQLLTGARISQVLSVTHSDITDNLNVRLCGSKGSYSLVYTPVMYRAFWEYLKNSKQSLSSLRDRFFMYRLYRKYGIYTLVVGNINTSVTHSLRHALLSDTEKLQLTERERANKVGHKSTKSQEYYLTSKREKNVSKM